VCFLKATKQLSKNKNFLTNWQGSFYPINYQDYKKL